MAGIIELKDFFIDDVTSEIAEEEYSTDVDHELEKIMQDPSFIDEFTASFDTVESREVVEAQNVVLVGPSSGDKIKMYAGASAGAKADKENQLTSSRFVAESKKTLETYSKGFVPECTKANTKWAVDNFEAWVGWRNSLDVDEKDLELVPENLLTEGTSEELNYWLSLYIMETRKKDGSRYPSNTLTLLLNGLRRYMKGINPYCPNFLDDKDPAFAGLRGVRDNVSRELRSAGIGAAVKHTNVITYEEEQMLWDHEIINLDTPSGLLNAVFYYNGKVLILRGGREHRELKRSQFEFGTEETSSGLCDYVKYTENGSKNRSGSYKDKCENKIVKQYSDSSLGDKCYVHILKVYFSKLPEDNSDTFYLRPLPNKPKGPAAVWFYRAAIGRNTLDSMVKKMFEPLGVSGKTNHSLRATGASRLFNAKVPEKIVQERSGHRSLEALRQYEHTSDAADKAVSTILSSSMPVNFDEDEKDAGKLEGKCTATNTAVEPLVPFDNVKLRSKHDGVGVNNMPSFSHCNSCTINVNFN